MWISCQFAKFYQTGFSAFNIFHRTGSAPLHQVYTLKTKKEQGIYPYSTSSADLPARTALILFLAVVTVL